MQFDSQPMLYYHHKHKKRKRRVCTINHERVSVSTLTRMPLLSLYYALETWFYSVCIHSSCFDIDALYIYKWPYQFNCNARIDFCNRCICVTHNACKQFQTNALIDVFSALTVSFNIQHLPNTILLHTVLCNALTI